MIGFVPWASNRPTTPNPSGIEMSTPSIPPESSAGLKLPPPAVRFDPPPMTDAMRARALAHVDELLAHVNDPPLPDEPDWDVATLFPPGRAR